MTVKIIKILTFIQTVRGCCVQIYIEMNYTLTYRFLKENNKIILYLHKTDGSLQYVYTIADDTCQTILESTDKSQDLFYMKQLHTQCRMYIE